MMKGGGIWDFEFRNADLELRGSSPTVKEGSTSTIKPSLTVGLLPRTKIGNPQSEIQLPLDTPVSEV
jgi:hypothetical protein